MISKYLILSSAIALFFCTSNSNAQQLPGNRTPGNISQQIDPGNARSIDSLQAINNRFFSRINNFSNGNAETKTNVPMKLLYNKKNKPGINYNFNDLHQEDSRTNTVCYTISGRNFLRQDSLYMWPGDPIFSQDGHIILSGEYGSYTVSPPELGGFCMKTDMDGNVIWAKAYDSIADVTYDFINYFKSIELQNGSIILAGRTSNMVSGNGDFVLTKLDNAGNIIWTKTYESRFWQGFSGSGDYFPLTDLEEDPVTGEVYFVGSHWGGLSVVTKVDQNDGHIIWSKGYDTYASENTFGIIINNNDLLLFHLAYTSNNEIYINVTSINKINGDTLFNKSLRQTGDLLSARLYRGYQVVKLYNGHYRLSGPTTRYSQYPVYTGTIDLFHAGIIELDQNFNFVTAFGFKNRVESNGYNTRLSLFPDGSGLFTQLDYISPYTAATLICLFNDELIYHQRKRIHNNEGLPYEPPSLQLTDGGFLNIKLMGDSSASAANGTRIDYYRLHTSDTSSLCIGLKDSSTSIWHFNFEPVANQLYLIRDSVFHISRQKTFVASDFTTHITPPCEVISNCDTLDIEVDTTVICPGTSINLTVHKNRACGSDVPLVYDTNFVDHVIRINDTTYTFYFDHPGNGYIYASLMGCIRHEDSVYVQVIATRYSLNLGPDTVICPSNQILLNAGDGFASYLWQDGSTDSTFNVTVPGTYYLTAVNGCGTMYHDTIVIADHPPIPFDIGPDRFKCNNDTIRLTATAGFINYTWSPNYNISSTSAQQVIVNPSVDTTYTVAAEKTPGCFAYDTLQIIVRTSPPIDLGSDTSICRGDSLLLNAGFGFNAYAWNTGSNSQTLNIGQPGIYSIVATTIDGCSSSDTLRLISLFNLPAPNLGPDSVVCVGQPRIIKSAGTYNSYLWNTGSTNNTISVNIPGQYWLIVTDVNGCKGADTTIVTGLANPPVNFLGADTTICTYGNMTLKSSGSFDRYFWNTGITGNSITITQSGTYWLRVTDNYNCLGVDTIIVNPKQCLEGLYVPSGFTPNGDGLNDVLRPLLFGDIKTMKFQVYNRWGGLVFETNTAGIGWDGNYKGRKQDPNMFVWICIYQLNGKQVENQKGTFLLIR